MFDKIWTAARMYLRNYRHVRRDARPYGLDEKACQDIIRIVYD